MTGVPSGDIAVGATVSGLLAPVAAALPAGARVVVPEIEFTSNLFPWLVHADRDVTVDTVPLEKLADAIGAGTTLVAFSLVQSATGEIAPVDDILAAARGHGALVCADASQACGWLPVQAASFDVLVCAAYKWLMAPRGVAFCYLAPDLRERVRPLQAGWYAGQDVHQSYYGPPLRLGRSGPRLPPPPSLFRLRRGGPRHRAAQRDRHCGRARAQCAAVPAVSGRARAPAVGERDRERGACRRGGAAGRGGGAGGGPGRPGAALLPPVHHGGGRGPRAGGAVQRMTRPSGRGTVSQSSR